MARKAEVEIGGYLADVELTPQGSILLRITGADIAEKVFEHFVASKPRMNLVEFVPENNGPFRRDSAGGAKCFP